MRILHTADWHIGKKLGHVSRLKEQEEVLEEICDIANQKSVDAVLLAGDIFDSVNPSIEAIDLAYRMLKRMTNGGKRVVIGIAGNHDSPDRLQASEPLARECGIILCSYPHSQFIPFRLESGLSLLKSEPGFIELALPNVSYPLRCILTAYANELRLKKFLGFEQKDQATGLRNILAEEWQRLANKYFDEAGVNILMTHLFVVPKHGSKPEEPEEEKPILTLGGASEIYTENFPARAQYVALGHLHQSQQLSTLPYPICYSGSPLAYSMSEASQRKYIHLIEVQPSEEVSIEKIPLTSGRILAQKRFNSFLDALSWLENHPNYWVELTLALDSFLTAEERKHLEASHDGIIAIIPEMKGERQENAHREIDLSKGMEELFYEYFQDKIGQAPNEELLALFKEIISHEEEQRES